MDLARSSHGVCVFDGAILALGGETPHGQTDSAEAYPVQTIFHVHRKTVMEKAEETEMLPAESLSPGPRMFSRHEDLPPSPSVSPKDVNWGRLVVMAILVLATASVGMFWEIGPSLDWSILNDYFVNANPSPKALSPSRSEGEPAGMGGRVVLG